MNRIGRICVIFVLFCSLSTVTFADLKSGWEKFKNNDYKGAKVEFEEALSEPNTAFEAKTALSLLPSSVGKGFKPYEQIISLTEGTPQNLDPYLFALWTEINLLNGNPDQDDEILDFLEELTERENLNSTMKALVNADLKSYYKEVNDIRKSNNYGEEVASVKDWMVVGTFDNVSASGYNKEYEPIAHPEMNYEFTDKDGAPVKWFTVKNYKSGEWINFAYHFYFNNSIIFAQTFCYSEKDQEVQLRMGTSGSLKLWMNDKEVLSEEEEWNNDIDTYLATAKLKKGYNRILVQIGESDAGRSNFMLRITDKTGKPVSGLKYVANENKPYKKEAEFESKTLPHFAEAYFEKQIEKDPENLLNYILLTKTYLHNDKYYPARRVLKKAKELAPDCSYLLWQSIDMYARKGDRTGTSETVEVLKKVAPNEPSTLEILYQEEIEKENWDEARTYLEKLEKDLGNTAKVIGFKIGLASNEEKVEELYELVDEAYDKYPYHYQFVYLKYLVEEETHPNSSGNIKLIKKYLKYNYSFEAVQLIANNYFQEGDISAGIEEYRELLEISPNSVGYRYKIGNIYYQLRRYSDAITEFEKCLEMAPYIGSYYGNIADCQNELGKTDLAIKNYEKAILYNPTDYTRREKLRELKEEEEIWTYFGEDPNFEEVFKNSPTADAYPEDNSVILLDETQKVFYGDGGAEEKHIFMAKVFNASGIDIWKEYQVPYYSSQNLVIEKAEVLKANGSTLKAETSGGHVVFTKLEEGDAIVIVYRIKNYQFGKLAKHFWDKHYFSIWFPYIKSKYSIMVPKGTEFDYVITNSDLKPNVEEKDGFELYTWEKDTVAAIKQESYMPELTDVGEILHVSSIPDWNFIADWYTDLAKNKAKVEDEVKETTEELLAGKEDLSDKEKVKIIYDYIVNNIRYSSISFRQSGLVPQKASKVLNTKIGDCKDVSTLFVSMCKEAGIDAELVLVDTRDNGSYDIKLPSIDFNHCIAKVDLGKEYYVELTSDLNGFSSFGYQLKNAFTLDIDPTEEDLEPQLLDPSSRLKNVIQRTTKVSFNGSNMVVKKTNLKTGSMAASMRSVYRDIGTKEREKSMLEAISDQYPNIKLDGLTFYDNIKSTSDTVTYDYSYTVNNAFSKIGSMSLLKLPWANYQEPVDFFNNVDRKYPVALWKYDNADSKEEQLIITIPSSKTLVEVPKSVYLDSPVAKYSMVFKKSGNKLYITRKLDYKEDVVKLEQFDEVKDFYEKMINSDSQQIAFK